MSERKLTEGKLTEGKLTEGKLTEGKLTEGKLTDWRRSGLRLLALLLAGLATVDLSADDTTYELRYKFTPNQFLRYKVTHKTDIVTQFQSAVDTTSNETVTRKHLRVSSVAEDGSAVIEPVIDQVQMTANFEGREPVRFDSNWDEKEIPARFLDTKRNIGQPLARVKVSAQGEFLSVKRLTAAAGGQDAAGTPDSDPSRNFLIVFPEQPVKIGDSWSDTFKTRVSINKEISREVDLLRTYRLLRVEDGIAVISMVTSVVAPIRAPEIRAQLIQREPSGEVRFDLQRGMIISRTLAVDKTVLDCFGPKSSMRAKSVREEQLDQTDVAQAE